MPEDERQLLGRVLEKLDHQAKVLAHQDQVLDEVVEQTRNNSRKIEIVEQKVEDHRKHDEKIAGEIGGALEPVVKHVTIWNGTTKVVLFVASVGGAFLALFVAVATGAKYVVKWFSGER